METIRTYLENMFLQLPRTPEILRAKEELLSMMEDKYEELKRQGKAENEAIGTVISEFGNLDEILEELGVGKEHRSEDWDAGSEVRILPFEEIRDYLSFRGRFAAMIGLGVALCILSPVFLIFVGSGQGIFSRIGELLGLVVLFVFVAAAVGIFIYYGLQSEKYKYLEKEVFLMDPSTEALVQSRYEEKKAEFSIQVGLGVMLCILSVVPQIALGAIFPARGEDIGAGILLVFVAVGVFLFIYAGITKGSYELLFRKTDDARGKSGGRKEEKGPGKGDTS